MASVAPHMRVAFLIAPLFLAPTLSAAAPVRYLAAGLVDRDGRLVVDIVALNSGGSPATLPQPVPLEGTLTVNGTNYPVRLDGPDVNRAMIAPGGFVQLRYVLHSSSPLPHDGVGTLTVPALGMGGVGLSIASASAEVRVADAQPIPPAPSPVSRGNDFLGNLSAYRPIYAVYGPGTNSDARLQISFQYQLFGDPATPPAERGVLDNLRFAYTQRMFWDLGARSSPFRNVDYMPELFYLVPERRLADGVLLGGQAGFMHQSNGRGGDASRSLNMLYVQPTATFTTGRYRISAGPRGWIYVGSLADNPDIRRYRGNLGLSANIDRDDGLRLSASGRTSVQTGRTSVDAELSYPLDALLGGGPKLYLFGQAFAGWGENLLDYQKRQTRFRIGFGIVR